MPRISNFEILKKPDQHIISIRTRTKVDGLPALIGASYAKMGEYLKSQGEYLADIPFVGYHNMDMQDLDVEIGFPVAKALPGKEDIKPGVIPSNLSVFCMYLGPYSGIEQPYQDMARWINENGYTPLGISYEYYYNSPEFPESELLTMIVMPVK